MAAATRLSDCRLIGALARVGVVDDAVAVAIHSRKLRGARVDVFLARDLAVLVGIGLLDRAALA